MPGIVTPYAKTLLNAQGITTTRTVTDGAITVNTAILTSATAAFVVATDTGRAINVAGAGVGGALLATTILSVTNSTTAVLATNASTTVSGATVIISLLDSQRWTFIGDLGDKYIEVTSTNWAGGDTVQIWTSNYPDQVASSFVGDVNPQPKPPPTSSVLTGLGSGIQLGLNITADTKVALDDQVRWVRVDKTVAGTGLVTAVLTGAWL